MPANAIERASLATRSLFLLNGMAFSTWASMILYLREQLELSEAVLGSVLLSLGLGSLISMPLAAMIITRIGSRNTCILSGPMIVISLPLLLCASSAPQLSSTLFFFGCAIGTFNLSINAQASAVEELSNRKLMSGFHCWHSLGGFAGALLMGIFMILELSMFTSVLIMASNMFFLLFGRFRSLLHKRFDLITSPVQIDHPPKAKIMLIGIFCFILFLTEGSMLDWSALLLQDRHGYSVAYAGVGYALFSVMMTTGRFFGDSLTSRLGEIYMVAAGALLCGSGLLISIYLHGMHMELLGFMMVGLGAANIVPILFGRGIRLGGSTGLAVVTTMGYCGVTVGPALIGFLAEYTSLSWSIGMIAVLLIGVSYFCSAIDTTPQIA